MLIAIMFASVAAFSQEQVDSVTANQISFVPYGLLFKTVGSKYV